MTLQQLRYIIEIVNQGTINEAAKKLFISQPSLSNAVKELEKELKIQIFKRNNRGITLSSAGEEFLRYARQVVEQSDLLEQRYLNKIPSRRALAVSTQHYAVSINAFSDLAQMFKDEEYEFTLREARTRDVIEDVKRLRSEVGVLFLNEFNQKVLLKLLQESSLEFEPLLEVSPCVLIGEHHPMAGMKEVLLEDLEDYPCLCFEQGEYNSYYFSEDIFSTRTRKRHILVSDKFTMCYLISKLNGYTVSLCASNKILAQKGIVSIPLKSNEYARVGYIYHKEFRLSVLGNIYIEKLIESVKKYKKELE